MLIKRKKRNKTGNMLCVCAMSVSLNYKIITSNASSSVDS